MNDSSIMIKCSLKYKEEYKKMCEARNMKMNEFFKYLVENRKEADRIRLIQQGVNIGTPVTVELSDLPDNISRIGKTVEA